MTSRGSIALFLALALAGCATSPSSGLSSLGREVDVQPLRG
jgi:hypothetical protein